MNTAARIALFAQVLREHAIVWSVIGASCIAFVILQRQGLSALATWFVPDTARELLQPLAIWRLWTPVFVHYTLVHLLTNVYLWWLFATKIESESRSELLVIFVISAAAANALQWSMSGPHFGGLSGVVYALLSYRWITARFMNREHYRIDPWLGIFMLALIPLAASGMFGKFANFAHLGGLLSGALLGAARVRTANTQDI